MSLGRTTTRERSCDLVAFATLATLAAAAAACATRTILYHRARSELSAPSLPSLAATHRLPCFRVVSRVASGRAAVPLPTHRLVTVLLPPPRRRRGAGHAKTIRKTIISGHEEQVPAVSRIAFGFTSSDASVELTRYRARQRDYIF